MSLSTLASCSTSRAREVASFASFSISKTKEKEASLIPAPLEEAYTPTTAISNLAQKASAALAADSMSKPMQATVAGAGAGILARAFTNAPRIIASGLQQHGQFVGLKAITTPSSITPCTLATACQVAGVYGAKQLFPDSEHTTVREKAVKDATIGAGVGLLSAHPASVIFYTDALSTGQKK